MAKKKKDQKSPAYKKLVNELRSLLRKAHGAWADVFLRLREVELHEEETWKLPGDANFGDFLKREFPNAGVGLQHYTNAIQAIELYGEDKVRRWGVEGAHALCRKAVAEDDEIRAQLGADIDNYLAMNEVAPDADWIRKRGRELTGECKRAPRTSTLAHELVELREENARLKANERKAARAVEQAERMKAKLEAAQLQSTQLKAEVKTLKARAKDLEAELRKAARQRRPRPSKGGVPIQPTA